MAYNECIVRLSTIYIALQQLKACLVDYAACSVWPHITLACDAWDGVSANVLLFNCFHLNLDSIADNMIRNDKERLSKTCVHTAAVSRGEKMVMCRNIWNKIIARFR